MIYLFSTKPYIHYFYSDNEFYRVEKWHNGDIEYYYKYYKTGGYFKFTEPFLYEINSDYLNIIDNENRYKTYEDMCEYYVEQIIFRNI